MSLSLADMRETGETVTAVATSDMQGSGRASLPRVDVRFTTRDGQVVDTTLEEPAEYLTLGDEVEIEIVNDPDHQWDATAARDESRSAWIFALIPVVLVLGALWESRASAGVRTAPAAFVVLDGDRGRHPGHHGDSCFWLQSMECSSQASAANAVAGASSKARSQ